VWTSSLLVSGTIFLIRKNKDRWQKSIKQSLQLTTNLPTLRLIKESHKKNSHHLHKSNTSTTGQTISQYWITFLSVKLNLFSPKRCKTWTIIILLSHIAVNLMKRHRRFLRKCMLLRRLICCKRFKIMLRISYRNMMVDLIKITIILTIKLTQWIIKKRVMRFIWNQTTIKKIFSKLKIHHRQFLTHTYIKLKVSMRIT